MSHVRKPGAAVLLAAMAVSLLVAAPASAQVYRCADQGTVRYTDKPCGPHAEPLDIGQPVVVPAGKPAAPPTDVEQPAAPEVDSKEAQRRERDQADAQWADEQAARKAEARRLREARISDEIAIGMTPEAVRRIQGDPVLVSKKTTDKGERETWSYLKDNGERLHVTFAQGRVVSVQTSRKDYKTP